MAFNPKLLLILGLVSFLSNCCQTEQFCDSFVDNRNEIGFVFRTISYFDYDSQSYLFIGDNYWYLDFNQDQMELSFWDTESKRPHHWFGPQYSLAMCLWRASAGYCAIGLINKNQSSIDFRKRILTNDGKLKEYIKVADHQIHFRSQFKPTVAFVVNDGRHENLTWFIEQRPTSANTFDLITELYEFDNSLHPKIVTDNQLRDEVNPTALRQTDPQLEIIGVYRQVLNTKRTRSGVDERYGITLLFKDGKVIKYCWTPDKQLSQSCQRENLKTLIDCNAYTKRQIIVNNITENRTLVSFYSQFYGLSFLKLFLILAIILFTVQIVGNYRKDTNEKLHKLNLIYGAEFEKKLLKV